MSTDITLTVSEILAIGELDGLGAIWAVAKALNLFPPCAENILEVDSSLYLVGHQHHIIDVVYRPDVTDLHTFSINDNKAAIYVLVSGALPEYTVHGFWTADLLVDGKTKGSFTLSDHTMKLLTDDYFYYEVISGTRNWARHYSLNDGKYIPIQKK